MIGAAIAAVLVLIGGITSAVLFSGGEDAVAAPAMISSDNDTSCSIADGIAYCWGENENGQVGDGTTVNRSTPTRVEGLTGVSDISAGGLSCAIADTNAYCWGLNHYGQIGDGTTESRSTPTAVQGLSNVTAISPAYQMACAIADGFPYCWGDNQHGQLGDGSTTNRTTPVRVEGLTEVSAISAGAGAACAISNGDLYCWGSNTYNVLSDTMPSGYEAHRASPVQIPGLRDVTAVTVDGAGVCVIAGGIPYCWGSNEYTQGNTPTRVVGLSNPSFITNGGGTACAIADGSAYCWGDNEYGQIGDGSTQDRDLPTRVEGLTDVTSISVGESACAVAAGNRYCWGGSSAKQTTPVQVDFP
ncbi:MAG: hypothetical protein WAW85_08890 [Gordonia sp. (in: high G+C Gram-positive bacteria)]|uniref:RCC1 domain-containing protein n=1 Tax=Gordonia sp. (in: high G+C Gram-positive bacteria) TaxID=84139 RepID=UPI003BB605F1